MPLVEVRGVTKVYRRDSEELTVLEELDLTIEEGEFLALMGPSGSGKSTLLNLLAGLDTPTEGTIRVAGEEITRLRPKELAAWRARHIGFIFQLHNLLPVLTALQNVELPLLLTPLSRKERREHAETALRIVGLEDRMHHYPRQLSGGQEQRVGIARAIVTDPTLILADEPTGDLDARSASEILDLLGRLNREFGKTIVMVTHDPNAAARAGRTLHLEKGKLLERAAGVAVPAGGQS
jgi:putative ABC transport system ATP-binding protein